MVQTRDAGGKRGRRRPEPRALSDRTRGRKSKRAPCRFSSSLENPYGGHWVGPCARAPVLQRLDNTQVASVEVGIGKARTAAIFRRPSKEFEDQMREGRMAALGIPGATPLQGGIPI